jgi:membrane protease YdiL (CAAX protease family)
MDSSVNDTGDEKRRPPPASRGGHRHAATHSGRRPAAGLALILAGVALLFAVHTAATTLTNSLYGEYGLLASALALATALVVERLVFGRAPGPALHALGLGRPASRSLAAALAITLLMLTTWPLYALATGMTLAARPDWAWLALGIVAQYGVAEELIFRGYLFGHLRAGRSFRRALLLATLVFATAHLPMLVTNGPAVGLAGLLLAVVASLPFVWLYERGGATIWAPAIVHAAAHAPKLLAPGTLDATAELAWIAVVMVAPYLAFVLLRRGGQAAPAASPRRPDGRNAASPTPTP